MVKFLFLFLLFSPWALAIPKNKLIKTASGQVKLIVYQPTQFGFVEETYLVGSLCLNNIRMVYDRNGETFLMNSVAIGSLSEETPVDNVEFAQAPCFPSMSSSLTQRVEPVVNLPVVAAAIAREMSAQIPAAYVVAAMTQQPRSQSAPETPQRNLDREVRERNFRQQVSQFYSEDEKASAFPPIGRMPTLDEMDFGADIGSSVQWGGSF